MASIYPLEVVEADHWLRAHPGIAGEELQAALPAQSWDPSVKGLVAGPQVLAMMDERLDWTERLGDAFLAQEADVMSTVQRLRARAQAAGNLQSTPQQAVTSEASVIAIEPVNPEVLYVPVYDPMWAYGSWWWPAPPYYWYPPGYVSAPEIYFGVGFLVGTALWGHFDWRRRAVTINERKYETFTRTRITNVQWRHDVEHRRGVPYRDEATRRRFGHELPGADARRAFRGYEQPSFPSRPPPRIESVPAPRAPAVAAPAPRAATPRATAVVAPPAPREIHPVPPVFESFGRHDAARAYSSRGTASRGIERGGTPPRVQQSGGGVRVAPSPAAPSHGAAPRRR